MRKKLQLTKKNGVLEITAGEEVFKLEENQYGNIAAIFIDELMKNSEMLQLGEKFVVIRLDQ